MRASHLNRKVCRPPLPPTVLHRSALIAMLNRALEVPTQDNETTSNTKEQFTATVSATEVFQYQFILLCAPSGYGKTTLLVDFAQQSSLPCCWYMLDQTDTDAITFLHMLVTGIQQKFPQFGSKMEQMIAQVQLTEIDTLEYENDVLPIFEAFVEALEEDIPGGCVLILGHYHEVGHNRQINELVNALVQRLPEHIALIIESRALPKLNLLPLLARRKMLGLGSIHFRLSVQEIVQLAYVQGVTSLSSQEAEYLVTMFDGWIAGILLGTRLGNIQLFQTTAQHQLFDASEDSIVPIHWQHLFSHLVHDVFGHEPEMYQFLREVAILQQMTPKLCDQLLDSSDALARLSYLEEHGFFVTRYEEEQRPTFTCHPILREMLCKELRNVEPQRFVLLHSKAVQIFWQEQDYEQAIYHALQAEDYDVVAHLIGEAYVHLLNRGHLVKLERWIQQLPSTVVHRHPLLLLIHTSLQLMHGKPEGIDTLLQEVEALLPQVAQESRASEQCGAADCVVLRAEIALVRSKVFFLRGQYWQAHRLCQQILVWLPPDEVRLRVEAHLRLGVCLLHLGEIVTSIRALQKALQLSHSMEQSRPKANLHNQLANAYDLIGNYALSEHHRTRALHCWETLHDEQGKIKSMIALGVSLQRRGIWPESERILQEALHNAKRHESQKFLQAEAYALVSLGDLYQDQGKFDQALNMFEDGLTLAHQLDDYYLTVYSTSALAVTYVLMGDIETAHLLLSEMQVDPEELDAEEVPIRLTEKALYTLAQGTMLLYQHAYPSASAILSGAEQIMAHKGLKREQLQCLVRLAACAAQQDDVQTMLRFLETAVEIMVQHDDEYLMRIELQRLPKLLQAIQLLTSPCHIMALKKALLQPLEEIVPENESIADATSFQAEQESVALEQSKSVEIQEGVALQEPQVLLLATTAPEVSVVPELDSVTLIASSSSSEGEILLPSVKVHSPRISIRGFGEPTVLIDDQPITRWRLARAMELFFLLLDRGEAMHKEQIMAMLWAEQDEQVDQKFRSTLHYLRKALSENSIAARSGRYSLALEAVYGNQIEYDVAEFQKAAQQAKQALEQQQEQEAAEAFTSMIRLYRGDYVQSFYSNWCTFRRDELRSQYVHARHQLALHAWRQEQWDESVMHWQHMLAVDECMEEAHYGLMRCYLRQGKRGLALRQYQRCAVTLQEEMTLTPGPTLQRLYQRILEMGKGQEG